MVAAVRRFEALGNSMNMTSQPGEHPLYSDMKNYAVVCLLVNGVASALDMGQGRITCRQMFKAKTPTLHKTWAKVSGGCGRLLDSLITLRHRFMEWKLRVRQRAPISGRSNHG